MTDPDPPTAEELLAAWTTDPEKRTPEQVRLLESAGLVGEAKPRES